MDELNDRTVRIERLTRSLGKFDEDPTEAATLRLNLRSERILRIEPPPPPVHSSTQQKSDEQPLSKSSMLCRVGLDAQVPAEPRFQVLDELGSGAYGLVYSVHDRDLDRDVAVKVLKEPVSQLSFDEIHRFHVEAKVTAGLEHPGVVPIYEFDVSDDDQVYLCMRKVSGRPFSDVIEDESTTPYNIVSIFLKVCDALEYAHSRDVIHKDIKPANIMIGHFGEVFVIDWGSSSSASDDELTFTPAYMSPQQAQANLSTKQDDIYSVGATFYHALTGHFPTNGASLGELIRKKQRGVIDHLPRDVEHKIPSRLIAIARKALSFDPTDRYQSIREFADDLERYQEGVAVSAYRESFLELWARRLRRNWRLVAGLLLVTSVCTIAASFYWHEKSREYARWGAPVLELDFSNSAWKKEALLYRGSFEVKDGALQCTSDRGALSLSHEAAGRCAVEFDVLAGATQGNELSVGWSSQRTPSYGRWHALLRLTREPQWRATMDYNIGVRYSEPFKPLPSRWCRLRIEADRFTARASLNGQQFVQVRRLSPHSGTGFWVITVRKGTRIDNIRLYSRGVAELISPALLVEELVNTNQYHEAIRVADRIVRSHPNTELAHEALHLKLRSLQALGRRSDADAIVAQLRQTSWRSSVEYDILKKLYYRGQTDELKDLFSELHATTAIPTTDLQLHWFRLMHICKNQDNDEMAECLNEVRLAIMPDLVTAEEEAGRYFAVKDPKRILTDFPNASWTVPYALLMLKRYDEVVKKHSNHHGYAALALIRLGRYHEVLDRFPAETSKCHECIRALLSKGETVDELVKRHPTCREAIAKVLAAQKRHEEVISNFPDLRGQCAEALRRAGMVEELIQQYPDQREVIASALFGAREFERLIKEYPDQHNLHFKALIQVKDYALARKSYPYRDTEILRLLIQRKAYDTILQEYPNNDAARSRALLFKGRYREVLSLDADRESMIAASFHTTKPAAIISTLRRVHRLAFVTKTEAIAPNLPVPQPHQWQGNPIGAQYFPGKWFQCDGGLILGGTGDDFWWQQCEGYSVGSKVTGNFQVTAEVNALRATGDMAKAGIMVATGDVRDNRMVSVVYYADHLFGFQYRHDHRQRARGKRWPLQTPLKGLIRIERRGSIFSVLWSPDGKTWEEKTSVDVQMPDTVLVGPCLATKARDMYGVAQFSYISIEKLD